MNRPTPLLAAGLLLAAATAAHAQSPAPASSGSPNPPTYSGAIQVTATRVPEDVDLVPTSIQVISGRELRDRGATDLAGALALLAGVDVAPGGDGGPAGSVPEFWGLKEFDAFLLVVDGVPWGGAFNPGLASLDLGDVERIEVQRGPAPVMYGATSFVGIVHVVRKAPAEGAPAGGRASFGGGSYGSGSGSVSASLPAWLGFNSSVYAGYEHQGFADDRTSFGKGHVLWRNQRVFTRRGRGALSFDVDATFLRQDPASPSPRAGRVLSPQVPVDSNQNPAGAHLDEDRTFLRLGYDREVSVGAWSTVVSYARSSGDQLRGFLDEIATGVPNAAGVDAAIDQDDLYFDTHLATAGNGRWRAVAGLDYLYGNAEARGETFDYAASLAGETVPEVDRPGDEREIRDSRGFAGLYANLELTPAARWRLEGGLRLSHTNETRRESGQATDEVQRLEEGDEVSEDRRSDTRLSGAVGATYTAWEREESALRLFANAKSTFKPAAIDFNLSESEEGGEGEGILEPETARSWEAGLRADLLGHTLHLELAGFLMDFDNLVVAQEVGGLPALANAGQTRFKGVELTAVWRLAPAFTARGSFAVHDARFRDYLTEFDGVPTQLDGNRLEMSPRELAALALTWSKSRGLFASAEGRYVGNRYLNKRNTALADAYSTLSALVGWRTDRWEVRLAGKNLTDRRDPVAESELGDAQYYRLPARRFDLAASVSF